jgi:hypothetical protein
LTDLRSKYWESESEGELKQTRVCLSFFFSCRSHALADSFEDSFDDYVAWTQQKAARAQQAPPAVPKVDRIDAVAPAVTTAPATAVPVVVPLVKAADLNVEQPKGWWRLNRFFCASLTRDASCRVRQGRAAEWSGSGGA